MDIMRCSSCGKEITEKPCQYCGSERANVTIKAHDVVSAVEVVNLDVDVNVDMVNALSEVTIEKGGEVLEYSFPAGSYSGEIVNASLEKANLSGVTPTYIRDQIVNNINYIERYASEHKKVEIEDEHSFGINLGIFKYNFKRTIKKT